MKRAFILTALSSLLLSSRAEAGVALLDAVGSCPAAIKNVITVEMLLSEDFVPWDVAVGVDTVDTVGIVDTVDVVDTVNVVDIVNVVDTVDTVDIVDTIDTVSLINAINAAYAAAVQERHGKKRKIKFGRRAAFNHSQVSNMLVRVYTHDGDGFSSAGYRNRAAFGIGFEVAGIVDWEMSDALVLNFSPGVIFRKPVNTAVVGTSEVGMSFPALLEWGPFGAVRGAPPGDVFAEGWPDGFDLRRLRLFGGFWVGAPFYAWVKWNGEESAKFRERAPADFGLICGVGVYVSDRAFVDAKGIFGLSSYDGAVGHRLNQLAIGVNYVK